MDMKVAEIFKDSLSVSLAKVRVGDNGTVVSYAEVLKKMEALEQGEPSQLAAVCRCLFQLTNFM